MRPRKQAELLHVVLLHQAQHEPHEADAVEAERKESMVCDEKPQRFHLVEHNAKVVEEILAIKEVVRCQQEVPRETAEPWQAVNAVDLIANRNDFLKTLDLHGQGLFCERVNELIKKKMFTIFVRSKLLRLSSVRVDRQQS